MREPLTLTVRYRGGSEGWWQIEARGRIWRRPGVLCLHDVLSDVYSGTNASPKSSL